MAEAVKDSERTCDSCAMYQESRDMETGEPVGRICYDPSCHGPTSGGSNNHWTAEVPEELKEFFS